MFVGAVLTLAAVAVLALSFRMDVETALSMQALGEPWAVHFWMYVFASWVLAIWEVDASFLLQLERDYDLGSS